MSKFDELVSLLEPLNTDDYGSWHIDTEHKGTMEDPKQFPFPIYTKTVHKLIDAVYEFSEANPDYNLTRYSEILEERGLEWNMKSLEAADISNMDAQGVMAMLMGLIRGERFCDGCILSALDDGTVQKWLKRLEEISCQNE